MDTENLTMPMDVSSINERVYNFIKTNIINLTYPPGYNLKLAKLSKQLGISPTPIKDALFKLAGEGLIDIAPRKGTYVRELSLNDIREILQIRIILETAVVESIAENITDEQLSGLETIHAQMISFTFVENDSKVYRDYLDLDGQFHILLFQILGNQQLLTIYRNLNSHIQICRFKLLDKTGKNPTTNSEHMAILNALQERNPAKAKQAMLKHLQSIEASIELSS